MVTPSASAWARVWPDRRPPPALVAARRVRERRLYRLRSTLYALEQPTKLELVVNLKTAKTLGITIPGEILLRTDKVIE